MNTLDGPASPHDAPRSPSNRARLALLATWANVLILVLFSPALLLILGWFTEGYQETIESGDVSHRLHEVVFGVLFAGALLGAASQLREPARNTAGFLQLCVMVGLLSTMVWWTNGWESGLVLYLAPLAALAATREHQGTWKRGKTWWTAVLIAAPLSLALLDSVGSHIDLAITAAQNHTTHWTAVAAFEAGLLAMVPIVAVRMPGYRLTLATLAGSAFAYGVASLAFPFDASSHRTPFSLALLAWAGSWGILWYRDRRPAGPTNARSRPLMRSGAAAAVVFLTLATPVLDTPPNVPHRPDPSDSTLMVRDVSGQTCRDCHSTGREGAPIQTASHLAQVCSEDCPVTAVSCLGCHHIDPVFEPELAAADRPAPPAIVWRASTPVTDLTNDMIARAAVIGGDR